jgi:hypothetical protein
VIDFETYHEVRRLNRELNLTPSQISAQTGLNIKTIRKWLDKPRYEPRSKGARRTSKLDPYKDLIVGWLEKHPYSGMQIFQRLRAEHGYSGADPSSRTSSPRCVRCVTKPSSNWPSKLATVCRSTGLLTA